MGASNATLDVVSGNIPPRRRYLNCDLDGKEVSSAKGRAFWTGKS